jgi:hypothetical protein
MLMSSFLTVNLINNYNIIIMGKTKAVPDKRTLQSVKLLQVIKAEPKENQTR